MRRRPPRSTRTDTLFPYTTPFRSTQQGTRMNAATLITAYYDAFNRGDREAMLSMLTDDVSHDLNQGARETGRDAFRAFLQRMDRCYGEQLRDIVVMVSADGLRAGAESVVHGAYKVNDAGLPEARSEERRVGKEWVSTCRSR